MQVFSPNMLKTFDECPKKYELRYIQKVNVVQSPKIFERGKKIHALAHYYLRGEDITKFIPTLTNEEKLIWQYLMENEYFQKKYVNSEYNLNAKLENFWIGGRLDAFMKSQNNYYILDYKTGAIPKNPEEDFQTMIYLICANRILSQGWGNNFSLSFVYIDLKNKKNHIIEFSDEKKAVYENKLITSCKKITTTQTFNKNLSRCNFCEFNKICNV